MRRITNTERQVLSILLKSNRKLDSYTLFRRLKVSFSEFSHSIKSLVSESCIEESGNNVKLTPKGAEFVSFGLGENGERDWRKVPGRFGKVRIAINQPYAPSIKLLDKRTFKNLKTNVE